MTTRRAAYDDIVVEQQNATSAARDLAAFMSRWLSEIGRENTSEPQALR